jgi:hypothetical protein
LVGLITDVGGSDFPWMDGRFEARRLGKRLRAVLEWFAAQAEAEELEEPPFPPDLLENWAMVKPDRGRVELVGPPLVRFAEGVVEWRGGGA